MGKVRLSVSLTVASFLVALVTSIPSAVDLSSASALTSPTFSFALTYGQSMTDGIGTMLAARPDIAPSVLSVLSSFQAELQSGQTPQITTGFSTDLMTTSQSQSFVSSGLADANAASQAPAGASSASSSATSPPIASASTNPYNFPVRGSSTTGYLWVAPYEIEAIECGIDGCLITDNYKINIGTSPGASVSIGAIQNVSGSFDPDLTEVHVQWFVLCYANTECNSANTKNFSPPASFNFNMSNPYSLRGNNIAHAYEFWGYFGPGGYWVSDQAKTGTAHCDTADNVCKYR